MDHSKNIPASAADTINAIAAHYRAIIELVGEDPEREGLIKTPLRAAKALYEVTRGYREQPEPIVEKALFEHEGSKMVIVKGIEFYSLCEHHILPFFGTVTVGYIPDGKIVGLSKIARIVDTFSRRLQVQERLTAQICDVLTRTLKARGVIVACSGEHMCMKMRGVEKQHSATVTVDYSGDFADEKLRREFFDLSR